MTPAAVMNTKVLSERIANADIPEITHHRGDDIRRGITDSVGGLNDLWAVPDCHEHR